MDRLAGVENDLAHMLQLSESSLLRLAGGERSLLSSEFCELEEEGCVLWDMPCDNMDRDDVTSGNMPDGPVDVGSDRCAMLLTNEDRGEPR